MFLLSDFRRPFQFVVKEKQTVNKSMLASKNLPQPITKVSEGYPWLRVLAAELALRLNEARETTPNLWPKTIVLSARNVKGMCIPIAQSDGLISSSIAQDSRRSKQAPWPFVKEVTVDVVAAAADKLWKELADPHAPMKIIGIGLGFTGVEGVESGLKSIDTFFKNPLKPTSKRALEEDATESESDATTQRTTRNISKDVASFVCSRCGQRSSLPPSATRTEGERQTALAMIQMEHEDFHLALDLSKVPDNAPPATKTGTDPDPKPKKKRRKESPHGIAKFFSKV